MGKAWKWDGDALGGCLAKATQGLPQGYSKAAPSCSRLVQGCPTLLQAAPGLLQAAPEVCEEELQQTNVKREHKIENGASVEIRHPPVTPNFLKFDFEILECTVVFVVVEKTY